MSRLQRFSNGSARQIQPASYSTLKAIAGSIAVALRAGMSVAIPVDKSSVPTAATGALKSQLGTGGGTNVYVTVNVAPSLVATPRGIAQAVTAAFTDAAASGFKAPAGTFGTA